MTKQTTTSQPASTAPAPERRLTAAETEAFLYPAGRPAPKQPSNVRRSTKRRMTAPKVQRNAAETFILGKTVIDVLRLMATTDTCPEGTVEALIKRHDAKAAKHAA